MNGKQIRQTPEDEGAVLIKPGCEIPDESELELPESMKFMLDNIRREWAGAGTENFQRLMNYVYETAPMKDVLHRGSRANNKEPLNLNLATEQLQSELGV